MMTWLAENIGTVAVCLLLAAVVALIIVRMVKDKKRGKMTCGGNCASCKCCSHKTT